MIKTVIKISAILGLTVVLWLVVGFGLMTSLFFSTIIYACVKHLLPF
jgi:hypothetical protein